MTIEDTTEETLSAITKAQTTGILESTGAYSYDLTGIIRLIPVVTPFRDKVPRVSSPNGSPFAIWRAFVDVTRSQPRATPGWDYAGAEVLFSEQDFQAAYQPIALAGLVTQDSFDVAKGLYDPYAEATMQVLNQTMIAEDKLLLGGQTYALSQPGAVTLAALTTGGSIALSTAVFVGVAARTGSGYFWGGNSRGASANVTTGSGTSTNSVTASIAAVKGAVAYDWFTSTNGTTWYYRSTTTIASTTITSHVAANGVPNSFANADISSWAPTFNGAADNGSANSSETNGLIATITGDYTGAGVFTTAGTGAANGAVWVDGGGAALTLSGGSVLQITNLFAALWNSIKCSPTAIMVNAVQAQEIANLVLGSNGATTFLTTDEANRISTTAGGRVGSIINTPAGGISVPIEVHTSLPAGTIIARTDRVPFPQANISTTLQVRTLRDYSQFDYATSRTTAQGGGPRKEFEIRSVQTLINSAPVAFGILTNIS